MVAVVFRNLSTSRRLLRSPLAYSTWQRPFCRHDFAKTHQVGFQIARLGMFKQGLYLATCASVPGQVLTSLVNQVEPVCRCRTPTVQRLDCLHYVRLI